jgi:hypothetical protein
MKMKKNNVKTISACFQNASGREKCNDKFTKGAPFLYNNTPFLYNNEALFFDKNKMNLL